MILRNDVSMYRLCFRFSVKKFHSKFSSEMMAMKGLRYLQQCTAGAGSSSGKLDLVDHYDDILVYCPPTTAATALPMFLQTRFSRSLAVIACDVQLCSWKSMLTRVLFDRFATRILSCSSMVKLEYSNVGSIYSLYKSRISLWLTAPGLQKLKTPCSGE